MRVFSAPTRGVSRPLIRVCWTKLKTLQESAFSFIESFQNALKSANSNVPYPQFSEFSNMLLNSSFRLCISCKTGLTSLTFSSFYFCLSSRSTSFFSRVYLLPLKILLTLVFCSFLLWFLSFYSLFLSLYSLLFFGYLVYRLSVSWHKICQQ